MPPPADPVADLLGDLERFIHDEACTFPLLVRIVLVHAQFETIHPFLDGNDRIGRLLIGTLLEHWHLLPEPLIYLSGYLKQHQAEYYRHRLLEAPKANPASYRLFELLPMMPRFTIERVRQKLEPTSPTATAAVKALEDLGIVTEMTGLKKSQLPLPAIRRAAFTLVTLE